MRIALREDVVMQEPGTLEVDRGRCIVRNLKLSGLVSKKGRSYLLEAYRAALPLYEGAKCNVDHHPDGVHETPFNHRFGVFKNARLTDSGVKADLRYNPAHPYAEQFLW